MPAPPEPVIVGAARTPIGKFLGSLGSLPAVHLGALAIQAALERAQLAPDQVEEVILGNVVTAGQGQNPARQAAVKAGIPYPVGSFTVGKVCGSGLKAVMLAANSVKLGESRVVVAGGMESMSLAPHLLLRARTGYRLGEGRLVDAMVHDGLWDAFEDLHMGHTGDYIASRFGLTREQVDEFALRSHHRAARATREGWFTKELCPVPVKGRKGQVTVVDQDEGIRPATSMESLGRLKPVFDPQGVTTAGNASQLSDGAAAVVVTSRSYAQEQGLPVLAEITAYTTSGCEPKEVMYAPVPAVRKLWAMAGREVDDYDLFEHNEAFASASVAVSQELEIPGEKLNLHGGAVALGHPLGCSGTRVLVTLLHALKRTGGRRGLATLCLGGGQAVAMEVEV